MDLPQISTLNTLYPFLDWLKFFNSAFNTSLAGRGGTSMKPNISTEVLVQTDYLLGVRYARLVMQFLIPCADINSTGKFLSPRRLDPIFTCLTAFNCNKIYTIGKPNIFSICQAYLKSLKLNFY